MLSKMITDDHQTPKNNQIHVSEVQEQSLDGRVYLSKHSDSVKVSASTAPISSTHISNNSPNDFSRNSSKNTFKANDDLYYKTNKVKGSFKETDDNNDCRHDNDSKEEMSDDSDSYNNDGYNECDGYNEYDECDRGYYYCDRRRKRKTLLMMSLIISPVTV